MKDKPKKPKSYQKMFQGRMAMHLEQFFPKGKCKERGRALVFNAMACIVFKDILKEALKEAKEKYRSQEILRY